MDNKKIATTALAQWLNDKMGDFTDPVTGKRGLSINAFAKQAGVAQSLVWNVLKGNVVPKADVLIRFAEFFEVSPLTLFRLAYMDGEDDPRFSPEIRARLMEIEDILADVPVEAQLHLISSLVTQAQMLKIAARAWEKELITE